MQCHNHKLPHHQTITACSADGTAVALCATRTSTVTVCFCSPTPQQCWPAPSWGRQAGPEGSLSPATTFPAGDTRSPGQRQHRAARGEQLGLPRGARPAPYLLLVLLVSVSGLLQLYALVYFSQNSERLGDLRYRRHGVGHAAKLLKLLKPLLSKRKSCTVSRLSGLSFLAAG